MRHRDFIAIKEMIEEMDIGIRLLGKMRARSKTK